MAISWDKDNHSQKQFQKILPGRGFSRVCFTRSPTLKNFFQKKGQSLHGTALAKRYGGTLFLPLRIQQDERSIGYFPQTQG